jgi:hypothetical protein
VPEAAAPGLSLFPVAIRKRAVVGIVGIAAVVVGVVVAYRYTSLRWGCPSYAEANRPRTVEEVTRAFRDNGIPLILAPEQGVSGARIFRHATPAATVWVVVCKTNQCQPKLDRVVGNRRRVRRGISFLNVRVWVTSSDAGVSGSLLARIDAAASALSPSSQNSRCFPD